MRFVFAALLLLFSTMPESTFIFDNAPFASCHASTVLELRNGDLLAAWFGGSAEGHPDVAIWSSRFSQGRWSPPTVLAREPDIAAYNPVLFYTHDGRLWLYYKFGPHPDDWAAARRWSVDDGEAWSPTEHLAAGLYGPIRAKPLILYDGTVVSGTSVEAYGTWACWIERSVDNGRTFRRIGPITAPAWPEAAAAGKRYGIIQPSVVSLGGTHLRLYARSTPQIAKICIADSFDNGLTWTPARTIDVPNPNAGLDAVSLKDGRVVLVYNNTAAGRSPLNLAVSRDGDHFKMFYTLESEAGAEFSYPAMIQARNGDLLITYTWKRRKIRFVRFPLADIP
ncbi:MAG TPA: sialidase family protein [Bryobacteraceae bacterium]|nr:sialidase family protein [Bryobacteraceae bacterium]